ncbi:hypothetical protein DFH09DRAFT_1496046 [Mycena vulgaris]|nr:hypothetical protein DFH09DRAFT_1496046 [Mycena vulgaris]
MNTLIKLLPRLRGREQRRSSPSAATKRPVKQPQPVILDGILDISKEASDAIAADERQAWLAFEIAFPPRSPSDPPSSSSSPLPPSPLPVSGAADAPSAPAPLRDVLASELSRRRNFKGRPLDTRLPIPPIPTTPPPRSRTSSSESSPRSLRRQPRFTDLNTASPIRRCRTFPLSKEPAPRSTRAPRSLGSLEGNEDVQEGEEQHQRSTTPPGTPTTLQCLNSATREMFTIEETGAGIEPLCIVKRISGATATAPSSPAAAAPALAPAMDALLSSLDDVYAEFHEGDALSLVSISLSSGDEDDGEDVPDLDGEGGAWRSRYAGAGRDVYAPVWGAPPRERQTWPCSYSFLAGRTHALERYRVQGSRSLPDLSVELLDLSIELPELSHFEPWA